MHSLRKFRLSMQFITISSSQLFAVSFQIRIRVMKNTFWIPKYHVQNIDILELMYSFILVVLDTKHYISHLCVHFGISTFFFFFSLSIFLAPGFVFHGTSRLRLSTQA
jgi:hypothetical protein